MKAPALPYRERTGENTPTMLLLAGYRVAHRRLGLRRPPMLTAAHRALATRPPTAHRTGTAKAQPTLVYSSPLTTAVWATRSVALAATCIVPGAAFLRGYHAHWLATHSHASGVDDRDVLVRAWEAITSWLPSHSVGDGGNGAGGSASEMARLVVDVATAADAVVPLSTVVAQSAGCRRECDGV